MFDDEVEDSGSKTASRIFESFLERSMLVIVKESMGSVSNSKGNARDDGSVQMPKRMADSLKLIYLTNL